MIVVGLFVLSLSIQLISNGYEFKESIGQAIFILIASWLLSFVSVQFAKKYKDVNKTTWWIRLYAVMIAFSVISLLL
jgi:hypothetical protein